MHKARFDIWCTFLLFLISGISSAQENYRVEKLPFSSRVFNDFSPVFYQKGIVFCSDRRTSIMQGYVANEKNEAQLELFRVSHTDSSGWGNPEYLAAELNSIKFEGPASFSSDGKLLFFTRSYDALDRKKRKTGNPNYGIFLSRLENGHWTSPESFPYNDPVHKLGHPSLSQDGQRLYFVSDQAGGMGGSDIYVCKLVDGQWSRPENLGPGVNSPANEMFPFVHSSGRLYFASDREGGHGKLDIYFTLPQENGWMKPYYLPPPFNSESDDFAYVADEDFSSGYFTSRRQKTDNIFEFVSDLQHMDQCKMVEENSFTYEIFEPGTRDMDTLTYDYEWDLDKGVVKRGRVVEHTFAPGSYLLKLNVVDTLTGAIMGNVATYPLDVEKIEQVYIDSPDTVWLGSEVYFNGEDTYLPELMIGKYYWNFGDGTGAEGLEAKHTYIIPGVYEVQLIVESKGTNAESRKRICGTKELVVKQIPLEKNP